MPSQIMERLGRLVEALEGAVGVARKMRDINPWAQPPAGTEYAFVHRPPRKRRRRTREGRLVRE
jgi:hypothetical protein